MTKRRVDRIKTGQNIRALRRLHGLTMANLQDIFGFTTPQAIYKWETGQCLPSIENLLMLADFFSLPVSDILVLIPDEDGP